VNLHAGRVCGDVSSCDHNIKTINRELQDRAIGLFREALSRRCFLGIGSKESLRFTSHAAAFSEVSRENRVYQKRVDA